MSGGVLTGSETPDAHVGGPDDGDSSETPPRDLPPRISIRQAVRLSMRAKPLRPLTQRELDLQRFTGWVLGGFIVGAVFFLWVVWALLDNRLHPMRFENNANFYDAQALAILHGRLNVPLRLLRIEGWQHNGHWYTYFGVFPSLIRIPFLLVDPALYGRMTDPSILVAWLVISLFTGLLMWRVRILVRGNAVLKTGEAATYGLIMTAVTGGSVLLLLAAIPWVYNEDLAWGIALPLGAAFGLVGFLERPTTGRLVLAGLFAAFANIDRAPTGYACAVGLVLAGLWMWAGFAGPARRRWGVAILTAGLFAAGVGALVNMFKFGIPFGIPMAAERFTEVNAHRRAFLAANGGKGYSLKFIPTTLWTYFAPFGIRIQSVFPYVTLPAEPPRALAGAIFDQTYRTASIPASMPLLFLLACWGTICSFMRRASDGARLLRIPLFAFAFAIFFSLVWGYIAPRFEADFVPFLVLGAAAGTAQLWRQLEHRPRFTRRILMGAVAILCLFSVVANLGIAVSPNQEFTAPQRRNFVTVAKDLSDVTGHPIVSQVMTGNKLPYYAPAGKLFIVGDCSALYISNGESFVNDPTQQQEHDTWLPVERGPNALYLFDLTFHKWTGPTQPLVILTVGSNKIFVQYTKKKNRARFGIERPGLWTWGNRLVVRNGHIRSIAIAADTNLNFFSIAVGKHYGFFGLLTSSGPTEAVESPNAYPISASWVPSPSGQFSLCQSLLKQVRKSRLSARHTQAARGKNTRTPTT